VGTDWKTIETAPRDGSDILLNVGGTVVIGRWVDDERRSFGEVVSKRQEWVCHVSATWSPVKIEPSHWMALPEPPVVAASSSAAA